MQDTVDVSHPDFRLRHRFATFGRDLDQQFLGAAQRVAVGVVGHHVVKPLHNGGVAGDGVAEYLLEGGVGEVQFRGVKTKDQRRHRRTKHDAFQACFTVGQRFCRSFGGLSAIRRLQGDRDRLTHFRNDINSVGIKKVRCIAVESQDGNGLARDHQGHGQNRA